MPRESKRSGDAGVYTSSNITNYSGNRERKVAVEKGSVANVIIDMLEKHGHQLTDAQKKAVQAHVKEKLTTTLRLMMQKRFGHLEPTQYRRAVAQHMYQGIEATVKIDLKTGRSITARGRRGR